MSDSYFSPGEGKSNFYSYFVKIKDTFPYNKPAF